MYRATKRPFGLGFNGGLYEGVVNQNQKGSFAQTDAISPRRGNEEAIPYFGHAFEIQEGRSIPLGSACFNLGCNQPRMNQEWLKAVIPPGRAAV